ncbi:MAG: ferrochelatase [Elusimicrobiota bacterium]|jgi:ferrochelatase
MKKPGPPPVRAAVLLTAYGGPACLKDVPAYLASVREGRPVSEELLKEFMERYRRIGGGSPMTRTLQALCREFAAAFDADVYLGCKHCEPSIEQAVDRLIADGHRTVLCLPLSPYGSSMTDQDYQARARAAARARKADLAFLPPPSWHAHPLLIEAYADRLGRSLALVPEDLRSRTLTLFTAHSLPVSISEEGDPYAEELRITAVGVAARAGAQEWMLAYQSRPACAKGRWLGPDAGEVIARVAASGMKAVVLDPIGFLIENLETLYDCDIMFQEAARKAGLSFFRVPALDDSPYLVRALAAVARSVFVPLS